MKGRNEILEFWNNIEKENNAKIDFRSYAILLGKSSDTFLNIAGLFYIINYKIIFENIEKSSNLFRFFTKKEEFHKYKICVFLKEVLDVGEITNKTARRCIYGSMNHLETKPISTYHRFFSRGVCQIRLRSDSSLFFDLLDSKNFICFFEEYRHSSR